jgi:hypothetical protein
LNDYKAPLAKAWDEFYGDAPNLPAGLRDAWLQMPEVVRDEFRAYMRACFTAGALNGIGFAMDS